MTYAFLDDHQAWGDAQISSESCAQYSFVLKYTSLYLNHVKIGHSKWSFEYLQVKQNVELTKHLTLQVNWRIYCAEINWDLSCYLTLISHQKFLFSASHLLSN